jgi:hypothetical protein
MKMIFACFLLFLTAPAFAAGHWGKKDAVACKAGPVAKTYGGLSWLVYGCADQRSILVVSNRGEPTTSEYIMLSPARKGVQVVSEGWGDTGVGNAAFAQLKHMSAKDLGALVAEASHAGQ